MAKIVSQMIGQGSGKIGNQVIYQAGGNTIVRAKAASVANPKTASQSVQRAILASSSKITALLRPYVSHSTQGVAEGLGSVYAFQRRALNAFRAGAIATINNGERVLAHYNIKGGQGAPYIDGLLVSKGSLTGPIPTAGVSGLSIAVNPSAWDTINNQADYEARLAEIGLKPGDQLSIIALCNDTNIVTAEYDDSVDFVGYVVAARWTFKQQLPEGFTGSLLSAIGTVPSFNGNLVEEYEGVSNVWVDRGTEKIVFEIKGRNTDQFVAGCLIRTQKKADGTYKYNNARLVAEETFASNIYDAYPSYMANTESVNVGDQLFLQNAETEPEEGR